MPSTFFITTSIMLLLGGIGGRLASLTLLPLPFMLGSLLVASFAAGFGGRFLPTGYVFPQRFRIAFIACIGLMIGARVTPELVSSLHQLGYSLAAISVFVGLALWINFQIFHRIGGMDRTTAFFAGAPGGLIESITLGEAANADIKQLVAQQFLRIIFVVAVVPIAISLYVGHPVGSAGGLAIGARTAVDVQDLALAALVIAAGLGIGHTLRLPAWQLTGPLLAAAALSFFGLASLNLPQWMINISQVVIGTSLGLRFTGLGKRMLLRSLGLSALSVGSMLAIGGIMALILHPLVDQPYDVLLITFAPGGVTEMGLIALSLHANPAFVTLHHIYRIALTVFVLGFGAKRFHRAPEQGF